VYRLASQRAALVLTRPPTTFEEGAVHAVVRDHGGGFDYSRLLDEIPDPLCNSGRGVFLIRTLMDRVEIRASAGTEVRMSRVLA